VIALAAQLRAVADRLAGVAPAQVVGEFEAHQHGPGILRDTVRCPACAATVEKRDREARHA
jgi:hypothetical protein